MKKTIIAILSLVAFIWGFLIFFQNRSIKQNVPATSQVNQQMNTKQNWESKTEERLPVTIKVTPIELGENVKTWRFNVVLDTHYGSLDDDIMQVAVLTDDKGDIYRPNAWEGAGPGGHHREGVLVFNSIEPATKYVELKINNVGDITERLFKWNIK